MAESHSITPEIWKDTPGFPGYQVSDLGLVRSFWSRIWTQNGSARVPTDNPRIVNWIKSPRGYWAVNLYDESGKIRTCQVHRLVLTAFVGPCPGGHEGCHKDGYRLNPRLDNLYWGTRKQNCLDTSAHGRNRNSVLTPEQIDEAIRLKAEGMTLVELGERYGVNLASVGKLLINRGVRTNRPHFSDEELDRIVSMRRSGATLASIGEAVGSNAKSIDNLLRRRFGSSSAVRS